MGEVRPLYAIDGDAKSVKELEREALEELSEVAERHLRVLAPAGSPTKVWVRAVAQTAEDQLEART